MVYNELLRNTPESLEALLGDFAGYLVPPRPPDEYHSQSEEPWALCVLRNEFWYMR